MKYGRQAQKDFQEQLQGLLEQQISSPNCNYWAVVLGRANVEPCNKKTLSMTLELFEREGSKWLHVIEKYCQLNFELVFSFCINQIKIYPALMIPLCHQKNQKYESLFEQNIEKQIDLTIKDSHINSIELWDVYIKYIKVWLQFVPHRTIFALYKMEQRLATGNYLYQQLLKTDREKIEFIEVLARLIKCHEQINIKKLNLRNFWQSIPAVITFLKDFLHVQGFIGKCAMKLRTNSCQFLQVRSEYQVKQLDKQKEVITMFFISTCQVSILQEIYLHNAERLAKELINTHVIDYWKYNQHNVESLIALENSLIHNVVADDPPSLLQQLLLSLAASIPNFLRIFLQECSDQLAKDLQEVLISDILLKLCILSPEIVNYFDATRDTRFFNSEALINRIMLLANSKSQIIQIKTLKIMHYFQQILPEKNFVYYHEVIFKVIKNVIAKEIKSQSCTFQQNTNETDLTGHEAYVFDRILYSECISILEEETECSQEEGERVEIKIRKKKRSKKHVGQNYYLQNINQMSENFQNLISIEGYCEQQAIVFQLFYNFLKKHEAVRERNTIALLKKLTRQFLGEWDRLRNLRKKSYESQKLTRIAQCIQVVLQCVTEEIYVDCETEIVEILYLLREPQNLFDMEDYLIKYLSIMMSKTSQITQELSTILIYTQEIMKKESSTIIDLKSIIQQLCRSPLVKSIRFDYSGLIQFFTQIFVIYITLVIENERNELYQRDWIETVHLCQLFLQTYHEDYETNPELCLILGDFQIVLQKASPSEQIHQLLMTIHHINTKSRLYSYIKVSDLNFYNEKYTIHLAEIAMTDILVKNCRSKLFDFDKFNNQVYPFLDEFIALRKITKQIYSSKQSSPNDELPLNKIKIESYIIQNLESLYKAKIIDVSEFTDLKNKLIEERHLIKWSLFN